MRQFQGSLGPIQELQRKRHSAAENPHLDGWCKSNERAKARVRPTDPDRTWQILAVFVIGVVLVLVGFWP